GEPVALRERGDLVSVDPVDEPIEMFAQARIGPSAIRRFEQDFHRAIELDAGRFEVPRLQLTLTGLEMPLRGVDERRDWIDDRDTAGRRRGSGWCGSGRRNLGL